MWNTIIFMVISFLINFSDGVIYKLSDEEYDRMPPIIHLEEYESCMLDPGAVYCTGHLAFVSDEPNALLVQMQEYTEHTTTHYNRMVGFYGTCITKSCATFYNKANNTEDLTLILEACQNKTLWDEYGLKSKFEDKISCNGNKFQKPSVGVAHVVVAAIFIVLVICNVIGSLYDVSSQKPDGASKLCLCFSIRRNWQKLLADSIPDPRLEGFKGVHGIRAILMTLVIIAHAILPLIVLNENTKFIEEQYAYTFPHIFLNGTFIMQIFLMLSVTLFAFNIQVLSESIPLNWSMLPQLIIKRWLRLTPTYAIVLGFTATWLEYIGTGPLWDMFVMTEIEHCRRDWWGHLFYVNNYFDDSYCMPQTWYLAADTQLYILGIIVLVSCKTPRSRIVVLATLSVLGMVLSGMHTYYQDLDAILIVSPSAARGFFINDRTYNHVYKRSHTNLTSCTLGLSLGYLLYYLQKNKFDASKYKQWRPAYCMLFPISVSIILLCKVFYMDGPRVNVFWRAIIASFLRPVFGFLYAVLVFGLFFKYENVYRGLLEWRGWRSVARVSYSAYLIHVALIRTAAGINTAPIHAGYGLMIENILINVLATYTIAVIFWLTVESPLIAVAKYFLDSKELQPVSEALNERGVHRQTDNVHIKTD